MRDIMTQRQEKRSGGPIEYGSGAGVNEMVTA